MIKHDHGATFILVHCTDCLTWNKGSFTKMEAHLKGAQHEAQVHPERHQARDSAWQYAKQHADELAPFQGSTVYVTIISAWDFSVGRNSRAALQGT